VYRYERELFIRRYLIPRGVPRAAVRRLAAELRRVQRRLEAEPLCLIHRDLQSTNVLLPRGRPALIDFQGMRLGPAAYDLASLLCDPYASLSAPLQDELLARYAARARRPLKDLAAAFRWAAVERLIQAIGAYARLAAVPETADFARHIRPALHMLRRQLAHLDNLPLLNHTIRKLLDSPPFAGRKEDHSRAV
jgi:aminoglycoside/choline kinase family phosphotransferase